MKVAEEEQVNVKEPKVKEPEVTTLPSTPMPEKIVEKPTFRKKKKKSLLPLSNQNKQHPLISQSRHAPSFFTTIQRGAAFFRATPPYNRPAGQQPYQSRPSSQQPYQSRPYSQQQPYQSRPSSQQPYQSRPSSQQPYQSRPLRSNSNLISLDPIRNNPSLFLSTRSKACTFFWFQRTATF